MSDAYVHIRQAQCEDASFIWSQWHRDLSSPDVDRVHAKVQERQLAMHLAGLGKEPDLVWPVVEEQLDTYGEASEVFVAAWLALVTDDETRAANLLESFEGTEAVYGVSAAVPWTGGDAIRSKLQGWANDQSRSFMPLVFTACEAFSIDPGDHLSEWLSDADASVRTGAAKLAGRLGRSDLLPEIVALGLSGDTLEAATLLGQVGLVDQLVAEAASNSPGADSAALLAVLATPESTRRETISALWKADCQEIAVCLSAHVAGEDVDSWIIEQMNDPAYIAAAGLAYADRHRIERNAHDIYESDISVFDPALSGQLDEVEGPYPVAARATEWRQDSANEHVPFLSHRRLMIDAHIQALSSPTAPLQSWTHPFLVVLA